MFTKKRKIIYSLIATTMLSSSVANAGGFNFTNFNYNRIYSNYNKGYSINYNYNYNTNSNYDYNTNSNYNNNSNIEQNTTTDKYPVWNWTIINTKPTTRPGTVITNPNNPDTTTNPVPVEPTTPSNPKPTTPPVTEVPSISGLSSIEAEVVRLVNIERQKEGLQPLVASSELSSVARKKSEDMAKNNYFSHTSPTYGSPFDMMKSFGISYRTAGENIARGQVSAQSVVRGWMNSSGHRANIMNPSFNKIGVGHYQSSNGTNYWTQMFTN
ncbi:CAP domain-containing protein [Tissierella praeacuta]|uniref:CAP domain-containing protein n=1 Tax=Tissierella praeacuta TaxID=43131 RepID=UPI003514D0A8